MSFKRSIPSSLRRSASHAAMLAGAAALIAGATAAQAADGVYPDVAPAPGPAYEEAPALTPARSILLGAGVGFTPSYEGSDEFNVFPYPIFSYDSGTEGPRRFEFRGLDDIRVHALYYNGFSLGPIAGYSFGRQEDEGDRLRGLGDVDGGLILGGFVGYSRDVSEMVRLGADLGIRTQVTGDAFDADPYLGLPVALRNRIEDNYGYGYQIDLGLSGDIRPTERLELGARLGTTYASADYMRTFFGVNSAQSANAAFLGNAVPTFGTGADTLVADNIDDQFKDIYLNLDASYDLTGNIELQAGFGYKRLIGDAADSPISVRDDQFSGTLGAAYRFTF